jgi:hypothetical protein
MATTASLTATPATLDDISQPIAVETLSEYGSDAGGLNANLGRSNHLLLTLCGHLRHLATTSDKMCGHLEKTAAAMEKMPPALGVNADGTPSKVPVESSFDTVTTKAVVDGITAAVQPHLAELAKGLAAVQLHQAEDRAVLAAHREVHAALERQILALGGRFDAERPAAAATQIEMALNEAQAGEMREAHRQLDESHQLLAQRFENFERDVLRRLTERAGEGQTTPPEPDPPATPQSRPAPRQHR